MFRAKLEELRKDKNWSKAEVARKLEIPSSTYQSYEAGKYEPDITMLKQIAQLYKVSIDYLVSNEFLILDYKLPNEINTLHEADELFIKMKSILSEKSDKDKIKIAQIIHFILKK